MMCPAAVQAHFDLLADFTAAFSTSFCPECLHVQQALVQHLRLGKQVQTIASQLGVLQRGTRYTGRGQPSCSYLHHEGPIGIVTHHGLGSGATFHPISQTFLRSIPAKGW